MCDEAETIAARDGGVVMYRTEDGWCDTFLGAHMASCDVCKLLKRKDLNGKAILGGQGISGPR